MRHQQKCDNGVIKGLWPSLWEVLVCLFFSVHPVIPVIYLSALSATLGFVLHSHLSQHNICSNIFVTVFKS